MENKTTIKLNFQLEVLHLIKNKYLKKKQTFVRYSKLDR